MTLFVSKLYTLITLQDFDHFSSKLSKRKPFGDSKSPNVVNKSFKVGNKYIGYCQKKIIK